MRQPERDARPRADAFRLIGFGVAVRLAGTAIGVLSGLATVALAVRLLGTSSYGVLAFAASTGALVAGLGRLGLEVGITRTVTALFAARDERRLAELARGAFALLVFSGVPGCIAILVAMFVSRLGTSVLTNLALGGAFCVALFAANGAAVAASFARGLGRMALMETVAWIQTVGRLIVIGALAALGLADLHLVALGYALAALAAVTVSVWLVGALVGGLGALLAARGEARALLVACAPFATTAVAVVVISRFDVLVLGLTGSSTDLGFYEPTLKIVEQVMLLAPLLFMAPYLPAATRLVGASDARAFHELYVAVSKLVYVIATLATIVFVAFPEAILHGLYGASFPAKGVIVWLLVAGFAVNLVFGLNGSSLAALGDRRALVRVGVTATASMVVLAATLIPPFGPVGAAAATCATYAVMNVVASVELRRVRGIHPFSPDFLVALLTSAAPLLVGLALRRWAAPADLWAAVGWSILLWAAWVVSLFVLRAITPLELKRLVPSSERR